MKMMYKTLAVLALLAIAYAQQKDGDDIEDFLLDIFGPGEDTKAPAGAIDKGPDGEALCNQKVAKCVAYYLCDGAKTPADKEISIHEATTACPSYLDICCPFEAILSKTPA